jgi:hypothetical protein
MEPVAVLRRAIDIKLDIGTNEVESLSWLEAHFID